MDSFNALIDFKHTVVSQSYSNRPDKLLHEKRLASALVPVRHFQFMLKNLSDTSTAD